MRIIDITQPFTTRIAVWPGDRKVELDWTLSHEDEDIVNVAALTTSVHAGTHADGFLHVLEGGETAGLMPLEPYVGPCLVVDVQGCDAITADLVADIDLRDVSRILFRTRSKVDPTEFPETFAHIDPELARRLAADGVRLVGTDAPSVDPLTSKDLPAHHVLMKARIAILESLLLTDVIPGEYAIIALPLRLIDADSSPVRAVLLDGIRHRLDW